MSKKNIAYSIFIIIIICIGYNISFSRNYPQIEMNHPQTMLEWSKDDIKEMKHNCMENFQNGGISCTYTDSKGIFQAVVKKSDFPNLYMVNGGLLQL